MSDILKEMAEGIHSRDEKKEAVRLVSKWSKTGLLEGLQGRKRDTMARLLENQAAHLLNEASTTSDITGFQNVAFPIVRRVFAGLIANELVSVQPMSLPSGLLFYLDYRFDNKKGGDQLDQATDFATGGSLFGDQTAPGVENLGTGGFYNLGHSFSQREKISTGSFGPVTAASATAADVSWDPDLTPVGASATQNIGAGYAVITVPGVFTAGGLPLAADMANALLGVNDLKQWVVVSTASLSPPQAPSVSSSTGLTGTDGVPVQAWDLTVYRRFTVKSGTGLKFVVKTAIADLSTITSSVKLDYIVGSQLNQVTGTDGNAAGTLTLDAYESDLAMAPTPPIPELDFTIKSTAVTANSRKLKARWTPELAQDLAAYQNLDAEVELTQVLSEAIALEIDREILGDLVTEANGANMYWSRAPGKFVNKLTGQPVTLNTSLSIGPQFTGTVREWYETLVETIIDCANTIHRKTLRGSANFMVTSPDVATILESSVLYKPKFSIDGEGQVGSPFTIGAEAIGTVSNRFTVYKDPYFPRNRILVGYKGGSYLETGYVYAPYVPLIVTPTIFAPEDFTPRKGVMTRYGKKMVRSDFYGTVTVLDMNII